MTELLPEGWTPSYTEETEEVMAGLPASVRIRAEQAAAEYLWRWTGQRFGLREVTLRPCAPACGTASSGPDAYSLTLVERAGRGNSTPWTPALIGGRWYNLRCGRCGDACGCTSPSSLRLPVPVHEVTEVRVDGQVLPADGWTWDPHGRTLRRVDGQAWPSLYAGQCSGPGALELVANVGQPVPDGGLLALAVLAAEFAKAETGDGSCQLPARLQTITRQGVTASFMDSFEDLDRGRTGIWLIDSWVASIVDVPARPSVVNVDTYRRPTGVRRVR